MTGDVKKPSARTGIVVIGRNEGPRLVACLESVRGRRRFLIYVDSGSSDDSVKVARARCDLVIELDPNRRFSAARARNEGFGALMGALPDLEFVQFVDGDCTLLPDWVDSAERAMDIDRTRAVVFGPLLERHPEKSIYNRLCAMEWSSPAGDLQRLGSLGGIMHVRTAIFHEVRGFNDQVIAGEDAEFGIRVAAMGLKVTKISAPMATHDADIHHFRQWWKRAVRGGHAIGQRFELHGRSSARDCARERKSVLFWGLALPLVIIAFAWHTRGLSLLLAGAYLALAIRILRYRRINGDSAKDARLYAGFVVLGKFAEAVGFLRFKLHSLSGDFRIIEYK